MTKVVCLVALESELPQGLTSSSIPIIYTGVGKLNASIATYGAILKYSPELVINLGTAGSLAIPQGEIVEIREVIQRDFNAEPLAPRGEIPFQDSLSISHSRYGDYKCGTGDSFVTEIDAWFLSKKIDVIDMELYGIAYTCEKLGVEWRAAKFITDIIGKNSGEDWAAWLKLAPNSLVRWLEVNC
jgi:adenosylhomocysteine nucleosidase